MKRFTVAFAVLLAGSAVARANHSLYNGFVVLKNGASSHVFFDVDGLASTNPDFTNIVATISQGGSLKFGGEVKTTVTGFSCPGGGSVELHADVARLYYSIDGGTFTSLNLPNQITNSSFDQWQVADGGNGGATIEIGSALAVGTHTLSVYYDASDLNHCVAPGETASLGSAGTPFTATIQVLPAAVIVVDGTGETVYGTGKAFQEWGTLFGDNNLGNVAFANGSELDTAYAVIQNGVLFVFLGGNLETNGNQLEIFIDSRAGGQNRLLAQNPNINNFNNMADDGSGNGLRFATGFDADFWIGFNGNGGTWFADYLELGSANGYFLGSTAAASTGTLAGGINPFAVRATINNSNTAGVTAVNCPNGSGGCHTSTGDVRTGVELAIPLAAIGNPTGPIKVFAILNNPAHDFLSNQMLKAPSPCNPVPTQPPSIANLGNPRTVNIATIECGTKYFTVEPSFVPVIIGIVIAGNDMQVSWTTEFGFSYQLQHSGNITPLGWSDIGAPTNGTGNVITQTDADAATNGPTLFYRVRQQ